MRISTNTMYQTGINKISELQAEQVRLQTQISTNRRIQVPSDDPVASARALSIRQSQSINTQFSTNRAEVKNQLNLQEGTLSSITELMITAQTSLISAGDQAYSDSDRANIASDLTSAMEQLLSYANTRDASGKYIFSGNQIDTPAFVKTAAGATYQGDTGLRMVDVASDRQLSINESGDNVFKAGSTDIFTTLTSLIALVKTPVTSPAAQVALTTGLGTFTASLQGALDNILTVRANTGSKLKELDALDNSGENRALLYSTNLSELEDLDYAKAISDISQQKTILEAAQQTFVKTSSLSLFNYIN